MKKIWISCLSTFLFSTTSSAALNLNYYVGISGGATINSAEIAQTLDAGIEADDPPMGFADVVSLTMDTEGFGPLGQLEFGGGLRGGYFYLGGEFSAQFFNGDYDELNTVFNTNSPAQLYAEQHTELRLRDFEVAFDLKPGIFLSPKTLLYARVGVGVNRLEMTNHGLVSHGDAVTTVKETKEKNVYPFRLGIGLERQFTEHFSIGMDYIYIDYANISTRPANSDSFDGFDLNLTTRAQATDINRQVVMLGLNYYL